MTRKTPDRPAWFPQACDLYLQGAHPHTIACLLHALGLVGPDINGHIVRRALERDSRQSATLTLL